MKRASILDGLIGVAAVGLISFGAWVALFGPEGALPMQYNMAGEVSRWGDRIQVGVVLIGLGLLAGIAGGMTGLSIARTDDPSRRRGLRSKQVVLLISTVGVGLMIAVLSLRGATELAPALPMALISALIAAIGAAMGRVGPNPIVGVRTPWTYKSRLAWDRSNRLAGRLFFIVGLIGLTASPFSPQPMGLSLVVGAILLAGLASVFESWRVWRDDPQRQPF